MIAQELEREKNKIRDSENKKKIAEIDSQAAAVTVPEEDEEEAGTVTFCTDETPEEPQKALYVDAIGAPSHSLCEEDVNNSPAFTESEDTEPPTPLTTSAKVSGFLEFVESIVPEVMSRPNFKALVLPMEDAIADHTDIIDAVLVELKQMVDIIPSSAKIDRGRVVEDDDDDDNMEKYLTILDHDRYLYKRLQNCFDDLSIFKALISLLQNRFPAFETSVASASASAPASKDLVPVTTSPKTEQQTSPQQTQSSNTVPYFTPIQNFPHPVPISGPPNPIPLFLPVHHQPPNSQPPTIFAPVSAGGFFVTPAPSIVPQEQQLSGPYSKIVGKNRSNQPQTNGPYTQALKVSHQDREAKRQKLI
jgi:hypothetical protein